MGDSSATPMMQQYRELKVRDPEALLLFRMGDFYELFGDDAERAAGMLGLTLTTRDRDKGADALPMAGFPHHQLESYLARLVGLGQRAAVCEQMEDPKQAKGIVKRDVVRVVTPGTLTDDALLDPKASNYLAALVEQKGRLGMAWVDLSTGRFALTELPRKDLADELARLEPSEVLVSETALDAPWLKAAREGASPIRALTTRPSWDFVPDQARALLCEHLKTATLGGFGIDDEGVEVAAAGALIAYLRDTQRSAIGHITRIEPYRRAKILAIDEMTRRSLELVRTLREGRREGSLLAVIDRTATPMGARLLADWLTSPSTDLDQIRGRHEAVQELVNDHGLRSELRTLLEKAHDVERLAARMGTGRATPRDLVALGRTLALLPRLKARLSARESAKLQDLEASIELCPELRGEIERTLVEDPPLALKEGGLIRPGFHTLLDELREAARGGRAGSRGIRRRRSGGREYRA